ncbi:hypothetical protein [Acidithiobacillus sp.]|uniref:hypothetical protein n=1 Tax=Acidithiobacillus sp. TaxID=1872118 RepID=UPI002632F7C5|nr:hypothetical protein [Acidithiobacillus sp.]MDD5278704.1 hypothetical protein [Acidithiobacillus sp.]
MEQTFSYSVSMSQTQQSPIQGQITHSQNRVASQARVERLETAFDSIGHTAPKSQIPRGNGFLPIKNAAKVDYFTIRADAIQDSVLSQVDSLAEYLVWDGMDRRLRAVASATNTTTPEATVSIQQIAKDIEIRVGHTFCERTIERAIKKLIDCGMLQSKQQFCSGRRQASSYQLCFTEDMQSRLTNSRRNKTGKTANEDSFAVNNCNEYSRPVTKHPETIMRADQLVSRFRMADLTRTDQVESFPHTHQKVCVSAHSENLNEANGSEILQAAVVQHIQDSSLHFRDPKKVCGNAHSENLHATIDPYQSSTAMVGDDAKQLGDFDERRKVCGNAHTVNSYSLPIHVQAIPATPENTNQPTPVSPLFKEERKINKNIFSYSDFLLKKHAAQNETETTTAGNHGYFLDPVHQKGWICSEKSALKPYLGDLSRHAFFAGKRNIEDLSAWFQDMEQKISEGSLALLELLRNAGIEVMKTQQSPVSYGVLFNA